MLTHKIDAMLYNSCYAMVVERKWYRLPTRITIIIIIIPTKTIELKIENEKKNQTENYNTLKKSKAIPTKEDSYRQDIFIF